jgi:hypothetical protein
MSKKKVALYIALAGLASLVVFGVAYAQDDILWLEHDIFEGRERPGVAFPHALHADYLGLDCLECHHIYRNGENVWDDSEEIDCTACHRLEADGEKMSADKALHTNCKGCHTKEGKGPVTCGECHPWKRE